MAIDPPYRLDPFQNIVNVGWGGGQVIVLQVSYTRNFTRPAFSLTDIDGVGSTFDVWAGTIYNAGGPSPPVTNPMSDLMRQWVRVWNVTPHFTAPEGGTTGRALIFLNLSAIRPLLADDATEFQFSVITPANGADRTDEGGTLYYVFPTFFDWISPDGGENAIFIDSVWTTLIEAEARVAVLNEHSSYRVVEEPVAPTTTPDILSWDIAADTYRKRKDFPATDASPTWSGAPEPVSSTAQSATGRSSGSPPPIPAYTVEVTVNLDTLICTSTKT